MIRVAVKIAYLGECFFGSQIQPGRRTVEGDVLSDLMRLMRLPAEDVDLKLASRTDKGVNSLGNVAVFNTNIEDMDVLLKALNAVSRSIFYRSIVPVDIDFNPRFADKRRYRYVLPSNGVDIASMIKCAELFVGEHDFVRFCKSDVEHTTITLDSIDIHMEDDIIMIDFTARYYLWNMVRRIVASIISVGRGDSSISDVEDALAGKDITFGLARPDALTLLDVCYPNIKFIKQCDAVFDKRIEEEIFRGRLKTMFFRSL